MLGIVTIKPKKNISNQGKEKSKSAKSVRFRPENLVSQIMEKIKIMIATK